MATRGWASGYLGLLDYMTKPESALYERYQRRGILDFLPESATSYEKMLAVCADDIIVQVNHDRIISKAFEELSRKQNSLKAGLDDIASKIRLLVQHRSKMIAADANQRNFKQTAHFLIQNFIHSLKVKVSVKPEVHIILLQSERTLNEALRPYLSCQIRAFSNGEPVLVLLPIDKDDLSVSGLIHQSKPIHQWMEFGYVIQQDLILERIRQALALNQPLSNELKLFANIYRETLLSGHIDRLPYIRTGLLETRTRQPSLHLFVDRYNFYCSANCECSLSRRIRAQKSGS
jgi:hypothetical protein